jgi:transposase
VIEQVRALIEQAEKAKHLLAQNDARLAEKDFKITALTLELAYYRRIRFGNKGEAFSGEQPELFEETVDADLAAILAELGPQDDAQDGAAPKRKRNGAGRQPLPVELPRIEHRHEPASCECGACGKGMMLIGEDISEQLDVEPARFFVHRHIRPQYACRAGPLCSTYQ